MQPYLTEKSRIHSLLASSTDLEEREKISNEIHRAKLQAKLSSETMANILQVDLEVYRKIEDLSQEIPIEQYRVVWNKLN